MNKKISLLFILLLVTSCVETQEFHPTSDNSIKLTQPTAGIMQTTPTVPLLPMATSVANTVVPAPIITPVGLQPQFLSTWSGGGLWVYFPTGFDPFTNSEYRIYTSSGNWIAKVNQDPNCYAEPSPGSARILCNDDDTYYLLDLETGEKYSSPKLIGEPRSVQGGKNILFYFLKNQDASCVITQYDVEAQSITVYSPPIVGWVNEFALSPNGSHLVIAGFAGQLGYQPLEILSGQNGFKEIGLHEQRFIGNLSWSPDSSRLIYGIAERAGGVNSGKINVYIMVNFQTGQASQIANAPQEKSFDVNIDNGSENVGRNSAWSPDGKLIAIPMGNEICIIDHKNLGTTCQPISNANETIFRYTWSPDSKQLAIVTQESSSTKAANGSKLVIYSLVDQTVKVFMENKGIGAIFWR